MYVLSLQPEALSVKTSDLEQLKAASLEAATFHSMLFEPTEKSVTIQMNSLVAIGDASAAERILWSLGDKSNGETTTEGASERRKLRTFVPILKYYCDEGDIVSALRLYSQMRESAAVHLDAETFGMLIGAAARHGWF